ncbi:phage/plasmid primase, P4 family [Mycolicibacterium sp. HK-90]|uniref:DNA primase family protein n=1 Tax=Mycolicibacterium sp. HK-90 TaxID=3056937 RepID=UPI002657B79A|nr:phage/plasmid primase, P4 family [Mycolicibacterium sp. HK-90]WKG01395.1 phage/plasmid primase, P4 family [Mycolicibacterium sp. HK-90]
MKLTPDNGTAAAVEPAAYVSGAHLATLWNADPTDPLSSVVGDDIARIIVDWQRQTLDHGRVLIDHHTGKPDLDPWVEDVPVVPIEMVAEGFTDRGVAVPTRQDVRDFAEADSSPDPEIELMRARWVTDPDLDAAASAAEKRINGVPESIYNTLDPEAQAKVVEGRVIAPPQASTYVARWLVRHRFIARLRLPTAPGTRRRRKAWMRTLIRIDQTWYRYELTAAGDPPRWVAHTDPEWMRGLLREVLADVWYVKTRQLQAGNEYSLRAWNPDTRTLAMVEDALADALAVGTGTHARELADAYGRHQGAYSGGTRVLVRNGVLDVSTGALDLNTPLWFSLTRIEADYDHATDPDADSDWQRMLRTQWPDDPGAITCLQQWFGYVISGRTDLQKWLLIIGPSGSGKSIIADVLGALAGLVTATKLDDLNSQFGLQGLYETGAQLAVLSDIRFSTRDSSTAVENLLAVTGEDVVSVARKYKAAVSAKLGVRFHASANEIPRWSDNSSALQRRALLLETSRGFRDTDTEDTGLKRRILANELGLVLRWAVEGLTLLDSSGGAFTRTQRAEELAQEVNDKAAPVRRFIAECCVVGAAEAHTHRNCECDQVDSARLYVVWKHWAETNGHNPGSHVNFRSALKALYLDPIKPGQKFNGPRVVWGVKGAETAYTDRGQYGVPITRTVSTAVGGDPMPGNLN